MRPAASRGVDPGSQSGIVTEVTEWPATIDRRYHDAVLLGLGSVITETASGAIAARDSTVPLLRRLRDVGVATAVYSSTPDCAQVLRAAGIDELVGVLTEGVKTVREPDPAVLTETASRLGVRPVRCVVIDCDQAGVRAGREAASASSSASTATDTQTNCCLVEPTP